MSGMLRWIVEQIEELKRRVGALEAKKPKPTRTEHCRFDEIHERLVVPTDIVERLRKQYPKVDIDKCLRDASNWVVSRKAKYKNWYRFFLNWIKNEEERIEKGLRTPSEEWKLEQQKQEREVELDKTKKVREKRVTLPKGFFKRLAEEMGKRDEERKGGGGD